MSERLDYEFTPTPRAALRAVEDGGLDHADYVIVAALSDRRMRGRSRVRFTLAELRTAIAWTSTDNALSKRLRRLRDEGWIAYEQPRRKPYRYDARLCSDRSEVGPSSAAAKQAESEAPELGPAPSTEPSSPSTESTAIAAAERDSATGGSAPGPSSPDVQTKTSLGPEERLVQASRETSRAREADESVRDLVRETDAAIARSRALRLDLDLPPIRGAYSGEPHS